VDLRTGVSSDSIHVVEWWAFVNQVTNNRISENAWNFFY
jgi:hypothetical protein